MTADHDRCKFIFYGKRSLQSGCHAASGRGYSAELYYIFYKNDVPEDACDNVRLCDIADADPDLYLLHGRVWICKI